MLGKMKHLFISFNYFYTIAANTVVVSYGNIVGKKSTVRTVANKTKAFAFVTDLYLIYLVQRRAIKQQLHLQLK